MFIKRIVVINQRKYNSINNPEIKTKGNNSMKSRTQLVQWFARTNIVLFCVMTHSSNLTQPNFQGECVIVHSKDWEADDMAEISARLKSVTPGAASQEFSLRRNQLGQLGFHVQHDGLITEVSFTDLNTLIPHS